MIERVIMSFAFDGRFISQNIIDGKINIDESEYLDVDEYVIRNFDKTRRDKLNRLKSEIKKSELYTSGVLIERIRPEGAEVRYTDYGKPFFIKKGSDCDENGYCKLMPPYFNITHSSGKVFCAWSDTVEVGVDYEVFFKELKPLFPKKLCTRKELEFYKKFESKTEADKWLLRLFTRKEAVSKLIGKGLLIDFKNIEEYFIESELFENSKKMVYRKDSDEIIFDVLSDEICNGFLSVAVYHNFYEQ